MDKLEKVNNVTPGVIISLTTIPSRSEKIIPTMNSLLDQTVPAHIFIHIPKRANCEPEKEYKFPTSILKHPNITIVEHPIDYGPSMKFIPAIKASIHTNDYVIVVDDDNIYPKTLVEDLYKYARREPSYVYCTRGWKHSPDYKWENTKETFSDTLSWPLKVSVITGCGGYIIPPNVSRRVADDISDYSHTPKECRLMDDIWISGILSKHKIGKFIIDNNSRFYPSITTFFTPEHLGPNRAHKNNVVISHFLQYWGNDQV